jgi:anti-anti-sigma factor
MALAGFPVPDDVPSQLAPPEPVVWREGTRMVVALWGEQDMTTAVRVGEALAEGADRGDGDVVVDLSRVTFMDAAIVAALVRGRDALRARRRYLTVRAPSAPARAVLGMCGLTGLIDPGPATGNRYATPE